MKTQICDLINGAKNVIRDLSASKYAECPAGTSAEFAGTMISERAAVAEAVKLENPEMLHVNVRGVELVLQADRAKTSGRIVNYCADITATQWCTITGRGAEWVKLSAESDPNFWHWLFDDDSPEFDNGAGDRMEEWGELLKECETCDPFSL